jgi:hypothetical protein
VTDDSPYESNVCVLCATSPATTREHVPAELFFARPLPVDLITVPACESCNIGSQRDDEYVRAWMMLLRDSAPSDAIEDVRARVVRQLDRPEYPGLRKIFQQASEFRTHVESGAGSSSPGLFTRADGARIQRVITKQARGLYYHVSRSILPADSPISLERLFYMHTREPSHWEPAIAAAEHARQGRTKSIGTGAEFQYAFNRLYKGDALAVMELNFYRSFAFGVIAFRPGINLPGPVRVPF